MYNNYLYDDDYIRSILGYSNMYNYNSNMQNSYRYNNNTYNDYNENRNTNLEDYYPDIYKIVYPMIQKACENISEPVTEEKIDNIVNEIYSNIEGNDQIYLNINLNNNIENLNSVQQEIRTPNNEKLQNSTNYTTREPRMFNGKKVIEEPKKETRESIHKAESKEVNQKNQAEEYKGIKETRQFNSESRNLIKILLIRELITKQKKYDNRPQFPASFPPYIHGDIRSPYYRTINDIYEY